MESPVAAAAIDVWEKHSQCVLREFNLRGKRTDGSENLLIQEWLGILRGSVRPLPKIHVSTKRPSHTHSTPSLIV